jgi:hypothetical protein
MDEFLAQFLREQYKRVDRVPGWVQEALEYGGYKWRFASST